MRILDLLVIQIYIAWRRGKERQGLGLRRELPVLRYLIQTLQEVGRIDLILGEEEHRFLAD